MKSKNERTKFIEFSFNYICLLMNDIHRNDWNPDDKSKLVTEIRFRLLELKIIFDCTLNRHHFVFVTYKDGIPYLVTEDIEQIAKNTGHSKMKILKAKTDETRLENFTFERLKVEEFHFIVRKKLEEYQPYKSTLI